MKGKMIGAIIVVILLLGGAFYGGMKYQQSRGFSRAGFTAAGATGARGTGAARTGAGAAAGFTTGTILSKDANSITLTLSDGSTKIVLLSASTTVMKTSAGSESDLTTGAMVTVTGSANSDGSLTAQMVQLGRGAFGAAGTRPTGTTGAATQTQ